MKKLLPRLLLPLALSWSLFAQEPAPTVAPVLTADQLDELLGPIALYPDALIALILPAAAAPTDIVLAARYLGDNGNPEDVASRAWDDSVKALVHYPDVVKWMDDNLTWTRQLGEAFLAQPADVMNAVQRLRARAREAGTLTDTPQQQIVMAGQDLSIIPAQPDVIYVPYYDPAVVYVSRPAFYADPFLTFSVGFPVGNWLSFDCDWGHRSIWVSERRWNWQPHRDWRHPAFPGRPEYVSDPLRHQWQPSPNHSRWPRTSVTTYQARFEIARPAPVARPPVRSIPVDRHQRNTTPDRPAYTRTFVTPPATTTNPPPQSPPRGRPVDVQRPHDETAHQPGRIHEFTGRPASQPPPASPTAVAREQVAPNPSPTFPPRSNPPATPPATPTPRAPSASAPPETRVQQPPPQDEKIKRNEDNGRRAQRS